MLEIIDCEQGSDAWFRARMGIPTASEFATVMAKGRDGGASKTRAKYMRQLAGEIITGEPMESYSNGHMERGKEWEPDARDAYCEHMICGVSLVGFMRSGLKGCSPDALVGNDGGLEIKSAKADIQIERLDAGKLPSEHRAQVQGNIWIAEREWWDFTSYCRGMPLFVVREYRDDKYIRELEAALDRFNEELAEMVERIRRIGHCLSLSEQLKQSLEQAA